MGYNLTDTVAHTNGVYEVRLLETGDYDGAVDDHPPNWAIVNCRYGTVEQCAFVLPGAIQTADMLKKEMDNPPELALVE